MIRASSGAYEAKPPGSSPAYRVGCQRLAQRVVQGFQLCIHPGLLYVQTMKYSCRGAALAVADGGGTLSGTPGQKTVAARLRRASRTACIPALCSTTIITKVAISIMQRSVGAPVGQRSRAPTSAFLSFLKPKTDTRRLEKKQEVREGCYPTLWPVLGSAARGRPRPPGAAAALSRLRRA